MDGREKLTRIGWVKWAGYEAPTKTLISEGERALLVADFACAQKGRHFAKSLQLGNHFSFSLAGAPDQEEKRGFGLSGKYSEIPSFGWTWFIVDRPGHALTQIPYDELAFERQKTSKGSEITYMKFLTDTYLCISKREELPISTACRIVIFEGSYINWPIFHQKS